MSCNDCNNCSCGKNNKPSIGWSQFALDRHQKGTGHSYYKGNSGDVVDLVRYNWNSRIPGDGETDTSRKVLVPIAVTEAFACPTVDIKKLAKNSFDDMIKNEIKVRQEGEDPFVSNYVENRYGDVLENIMDEASDVKVVLYSADALQENGGERSTDCDWEIVCIIVSPVDNEPMEPLTMARNMLEKPGGTASTYTAEEFAESIYYWSQKVKVK